MTRSPILLWSSFPFGRIPRPGDCVHDATGDEGVRRFAAAAILDETDKRWRTRRLTMALLTGGARAAGQPKRALMVGAPARTSWMRLMSRIGTWMVVPHEPFPSVTPHSPMSIARWSVVMSWT